MQNHTVSRSEISGTHYSPEALIKIILRDRIFFEQSGGGVTFSGGEPLIQHDFLFETLIRCKEEELHTALDTTGYADFSLIEKVYEYVDLFLYDIKLIDDDEHKKYTDVSNQIIIENIVKLSKMGNKIAIRIPLIPGITDTQKNLVATAEFLQKLPTINKIDLLPYNKIMESKYDRFNKELKLDKLPMYTDSELEEIRTKYFHFFGNSVNIRG